MASVLVPVFYVVVVFGGLFVFGQFYGKRSASKSSPSLLPSIICYLHLKAHAALSFRQTGRALLPKTRREGYLCYTPSAY
jgi:hypothetical protein